jgi:hypothetical protein
MGKTHPPFLVPLKSNREKSRGAEKALVKIINSCKMHFFFSP